MPNAKKGKNARYSRIAPLSKTGKSVSVRFIDSETGNVSVFLKPRVRAYKTRNVTYGVIGRQSTIHARAVMEQLGCAYAKICGEDREDIALMAKGLHRFKK